MFDKMSFFNYYVLLIRKIKLKRQVKISFRYLLIYYIFYVQFILSQIKNKFEELNILSELKFPLIYDHLQVKDLRSIVLDYLPIYSEKLGRTCYIFIDGIDHAARASDKKETFLSQIPQPDTIHGDVKFVLVGQSIDNEDINRLVSDENAVCKSLLGLKEQEK